MPSEPGPDGAAPLRVEIADAIATITLDRPDALNALTVPMKTGLLAAFRSIGRDRSVRAVVLTGAGRAFCAGQDLKERLEPDAAPLAVELRERYNPIIRAMRALDQPIVGAINGVAAGAGASLAFACDLRVAAEDASFVLAFGRIGLVPDSGGDLVPAAARRPGQGGRAGAARRDRCRPPTPSGSGWSRGSCRRMTLAARPGRSPRGWPRSPRSRWPRRSARSSAAWSLDLDAALEEEAYRQGIAGATADHAEGIAAFVEKRPPRFTGEYREALAPRRWRSLDAGLFAPYPATLTIVS